MAKKHVDPLKAKAKKQKIIAAVLGVLFIGVLAFQVPRLMKMMKTPPNPHANDTTTTTPAGTPSLAAPSLRGAEQPQVPNTDPTTGAALASSDTPTIQDGQLASFSRFASKDPFNQQLGDSRSSSPSSSSGSGSASGSGGTSGSPQTPSSSSPRPGSAIISVNGTLYTVATSSDFPQENPLFHLVSVTAHSAKISIAGGSYSTGAATVTLKENKSVTLVNTADGTRYTLILKPPGTSVPGGTSSSAGSSAGSGSATTTTTPSSTTVTLPSP